ncbi:hypothetical protein H4R33_004922 [Dimargaris cristalligena]|nr:hypothetical protein H4R33_004922 [Dimargaris cristalligena]
MIRIRTSEGMELEVEREIMEQSMLIKGLLEDVGHSNAVLPLPNVSGPILAKVIEYCRHHQLHNRRPAGPSGSTPDGTVGSVRDDDEGVSQDGGDSRMSGTTIPAGGAGPDPIRVTFAPPSSTVTVANSARVTAFTTTRAPPANIYPVHETPADLSTSTLTASAAMGPQPARQTITLGDWDREFCNVDQGTLYELILAANYLDIKPLLDLTCLTVANMIKGKMPDEIRRTFNVKNDFTPEEEEAVRKENEWCEDR